MFKHIASAIAFSPRFEAVLSESILLSRKFDSRLTLIHVGKRTKKKDQEVDRVFKKLNVAKERVKIEWREGDVAKQLLKTCEENKVDLLVAGAFKKENLIRYYVGSVARQILRKADCSVLVITDPSTKPHPVKSIVVNGEQSTHLKNTLKVAYDVGRAHHSRHLHVLRDIKLYGLNLVVAGEEFTENEYGEARKQLVHDEIEEVEKVMNGLDKPKNLHVNVKVTGGKSGYEIVKFSEKFHADLIIYCAPNRKLKFIDRIFPHDLEYIIADLPTNLLVYHP